TSANLCCPRNGKQRDPRKRIPCASPSPLAIADRSRSPTAGKAAARAAASPVLAVSSLQARIPAERADRILAFRSMTNAQLAVGEAHPELPFMSSLSVHEARRQPLATLPFVFLSSLAAAMPAAYAQGAHPLEPVVVTATRSETTIDRALADVVVIDSQTLRDAGVASLPELLRSAGGVEISQSGGTGTVSGLFLRGTKTSQTLVLVDGVRIENPLSGGGLPEYLPLEAIERIEIVRGPMSSLYGSGAIGGVIQIFTRKADTPGWRPYASVGAGSQGTARAQAGFRGAQDGTSVALSASAERSSGFNATRRSNPDFQPDRDGQRQRSLTASLSQRLANDWELG